MTPFEAYSTYLAVKHHFSRESYSYKKYNGKVKVTYASFEKRPDKYQFSKLAKKKNLVDFLVSNMVHGNRMEMWVGDMLSDGRSDEIFMQRKKRIESLTYNFTQELSKIDDLQSAATVTDGEHPELLKMYARGDLSLETMIIICDVIKCIPYWNKHIREDVIWPRYRLLFKKYAEFFEYDKEKYFKIIAQKCATD